MLMDWRHPAPVDLSGSDHHLVWVSGVDVTR